LLQKVGCNLCTELMGIRIDVTHVPLSLPPSEGFSAGEDAEEVLNTSLLEAERSVLIEVLPSKWDKESGWRAALFST
jgi:hypothetical protein